MGQPDPGRMSPGWGGLDDLDDVERVSELAWGTECGHGLLPRGSVDPASVAAVPGAVLCRAIDPRG